MDWMSLETWTLFDVEMVVSRSIESHVRSSVGLWLRKPVTGKGWKSVSAQVFASDCWNVH